MRVILCLALFIELVLGSLTVEEAKLIVAQNSNASYSKLMEASNMLANKLDEEGLVEVAPLLGKLFFFGRCHGVLKPDYGKAFQYFSKGQDPYSMYMVSLCYSMGLGTKRSTPHALVHLTVAAKAGSNEAQIALGYRYAAGIGVTTNCPKARDYYYQPAKRVANWYSESKRSLASPPLLLSQDPRAKSSQSDLVEYYAYSADNDEENTLLVLGQIYYEGYNEARIDFEIARKYFEKAASLGSAMAKGYLGQMYLKGEGVPKDTNKAYHLFREAAKAGSPIANNGLGVMYRDGIEVVKDNEEAMKYFIKAADELLAEAEYNAGVLLAKMSPHDVEGKALSLLVRAFQQGHVLAQYEIAKRGLHNEFVCNFSLVLFRGVVEKGPDMVLFNEAYSDYRNGDVEVALAKYLFLADQGFEIAQYNAAYILFKSKQPHGYARALPLFHRAAAQGNIESRVLEGDIFYYGLGIPAPDMIAAFVSYRDAMNRNCPQASFNIGYMYEHGLGVPKDYQMAKRYYEMAATINPKKVPEAWLPVKLAVLKLNVKGSGVYVKAIKDCRHWPILISLVVGVVTFQLSLKWMLRRHPTNRQV